MKIVRRAVGGVLCLMVSAAIQTASPVPAVAAQDPLPVVGQLAVMGTRASGSPMVMSLHAVRRTSGSTMVYYSVGLPPGADLGDSKDARSALALSMGPSSSVNLTTRFGSTWCDVGVVDHAASTMHVTVQDGVCTTEPRSIEAGKAYVFAVGVAPLSASVKSVDVSVRGAVFQNVPVTEGVLEPQANDDYAPVFGVAWPKVDVTKTGKDPAKSVYPFYESVSDLAGAVTTTATTIDLNSAILFAHDSAEVTPEGVAAIQSAATTLKDEKVTGTVSVVGHTDSDGDDAYNLDLSKRRAQAVATVLQPLLPSGVTLTTDGKGESEPIADNQTDDGKARNRRVTLTFTPGAAS